MRVREPRTGFCYLLTEQSLDTAAGCEIRLYGVDRAGPLALRFTGREPLFFIPRESPSVRGGRRRPLELKSLADEELDGLYFPSLRSFYDTRRSMRDGGARLLESDVRPEERFLMERFIHRTLEYRGEFTIKGGMRTLENPDIRAADYLPRFSRLSLDIETGPANEVYCIGYHFTDPSGGEQGAVHMVGGEGGGGDGFRLYSYPDEASMLAGAMSAILALDPDLMVGWNVIGFDLERLIEAYRRAGLRFSLGRDGGEVKTFQKQSGMRSAEIAGRIVLDGPQVMRSGFHRFENFALDTVAHELLGTGKTISDEDDKFAEIIRLFKEDKAELARYNFEDCRLVSRILDTSGVQEQFLTRSLVTGLRLDKVSMSVAAFDFFYLPRFHRAGFVAPDTADIRAEGHAAGGHVFTSDAGLYRQVAILDFKSLYPSIIRSFNIDPLSRHLAEQNPGETPAGIRFHRTASILPEQIGKLLERRGEAKKAGDAALSQAIKILMNSFYGVMGTPGCRFYHPDLPTAITGTGQWVLKETARFLRERGYGVIYGDTDSVFVQLDPDQSQGEERIDATAAALVDEVNSYFRKSLAEEYGAESYLELEYEKRYEVFFLPPMRTGGEGARKRYVGRLAGSGEIEFRGMESVRSDWTELARRFQRELFERFFSEREIPDWLRATVEEVKSGARDSELVYKRRLTKNSREYTKNVPPHVRAARMLDPEEKLNLRSVEYLITPEGPVPVKFRPMRIDYAHYLEKQLKPVADGVLPFLGTSFDEIIAGKQLELF